MKYQYILTSAIIFLLAGCASMQVDNPNATGLKSSKGKKVKLLNPIPMVKVGMNYNEIKSILSDHIVIGYSLKDDKSDTLEEIHLKNPYKEEVLSKKDKHYTIVYYYLKVQKADGIIANDELIPLVFHKDKLIGKGWQFLHDIKRT